MKNIVVKIIILVVVIAVIDVNAAFAAPAAYIDPNTGGMLFQILAVAFTLLSGVIFFFSSRIKMAFARAMRFFREKTGKQVAPASDTQTSENR
ncbi:MAG: hypothetical protein GY803_04240 [Chloroflexi bacterium]|nr:hypothetical protein [Chloroflexota bacterium]